jgi:hypothetical protein
MRIACIRTHAVLGQTSADTRIRKAPKRYPSTPDHGRPTVRGRTARDGGDAARLCWTAAGRLDELKIGDLALKTSFQDTYDSLQTASFAHDPAHAPVARPLAWA